MGVGDGRGSGRQTTAGLGAAHEQSNAARARMDASLSTIILLRNIFEFLDQKTIFPRQRDPRVSNPKSILEGLSELLHF